ncbi:MAG: hypothetical protein WB664_02615, partial [Nitrososphaeraceae archaeon]
TGGTGGAGGIGCVAGAVDVECDGGAGAGGAPGGNNLGLRRSTDGATSCLQGGKTSPACATSDGGNGNGGTGADGASACETTGSCVNDNSGS